MSQISTLHGQARSFQRRWAMASLQKAIDRGEWDIVCYSARGCGKTLGLCDLFHRWALLYPGMTQVWLKRYRIDLARTVLPSFENEILPDYAGALMIHGKSMESRECYEYENGSRILLMGLDDPKKTKSMQADIFWCNELTELSFEEWEDVAAANRPSRFGMFPYRLKIGDTNPGPSGHFTNKLCPPFPRKYLPDVPEFGDIDARDMKKWFTPEKYLKTQEYNLEPLKLPYKLKKIVFTIADNPGYWNIDKWDFYPNGLEYIKNKIAPMTGVKRRRYLKGESGTESGVVFPEFSKPHLVTPFPIPREWPCYLAKDPGRDHHDATIIIAVAPKFVEIKSDGKTHKMYKLYVCHEIITGNTSALQRASNTEEDAKMIDALQPLFRIICKLGDPHMMFSETKFSADGTTIAQQMRRYGHVFTPAPAARNQEEIAAQCDLIRAHLTTVDTLGEPMLQVFDTCTEVINGFESWSYKRDARGGITPGPDKFEDKNDDEMDALRMIISSNPVHVAPSLASFDTGKRR